MPTSTLHPTRDPSRSGGDHSRRLSTCRRGKPAGHVSVVVQADPGCDPKKTLLTANEVFDAATGNHGGVYLISLAQLNAGYLRGSGYPGWSDPVCAGALLPAGTIHPAPPGA